MKWTLWKEVNDREWPTMTYTLWSDRRGPRKCLGSQDSCNMRVQGRYSHLLKYTYFSLSISTSRRSSSCKTSYISRVNLLTIYFMQIVWLGSVFWINLPTVSTSWYLGVYLEGLFVRFLTLNVEKRIFFWSAKLQQEPFFRTNSIYISSFYHCFHLVFRQGSLCVKMTSTTLQH